MGEYKFGKPDEEISVTDLAEKLEHSSLSLRKKAYIILLYWLGCRRSEPLVLTKEDLEEKDGSLYVSIHYRQDQDGKRILFSRGKRGQAGGPTELPLTLYGLDVLCHVWKKTRKGRKLFPFSDLTGYRAVKALWPHKTPHWLRYNRVTKLRKKLGTDFTLDAIKSFTGIRRDTTIQNYGLKTRADIHKIATMLD